jgi:hypothetical protein
MALPEAYVPAGRTLKVIGTRRSPLDKEAVALDDGTYVTVVYEFSYCPYLGSYVYFIIWGCMMCYSDLKDLCVVSSRSTVNVLWSNVS